MQRSTESNNKSYQYLKGTSTQQNTAVQEKISRNGSRSIGLRRKNGVNIIDDFLQKAIDTRDIELLTASITVAKDIITNDGPENEPNQASPSRISPRQRQLLSGDIEAMNLIVRAEGYLTLLTKQKLSHEAVAAICRRDMRGGVGVSRDENEDGNGHQQVDAFVESFYSSYQSSLMHVNASRDSRDGIPDDALLTGTVHAVTVTPAAAAESISSSSSSSSAATTIPPLLVCVSTTPTTVPVPTPSTVASLEVRTTRPNPTLTQFSLH